MKLHLKLITAAVLSTVVSSSVFAAYGPAPASYAHKPCPWSLSVGYGQMFDHDKGTYTTVATPSSGDATTTKNTLKLDNVKLYEADLFHCSGFGAVVMGSAENAKITNQGTTQSPASTKYGTYKFTAFMLGYKMNMANNVSVRVAVGQADQKYNLETAVGSVKEVKLNGKMAANLEAKYHFKMSKNMTAFVAGGYLNLEDYNKQYASAEADSVTTTHTLKMDPSAGYVKVGLQFVM